MIRVGRNIHFGKRNVEAAKSLSQMVDVFGGSEVVGGLEGVSVGGAGVGVGGGALVCGVGLGDGREAFFRFTVFLLASFLSSSSCWARFHLPTCYRRL